MKTRSDRHSVQWKYAHDMWDAQANGAPLPEQAFYTVWDINEKGQEKVSKRLPADLMNVRFGIPWSTK